MPSYYSPLLHLQNYPNDSDLLGQDGPENILMVYCDMLPKHFKDKKISYSLSVLKAAGQSLEKYQDKSFDAIWKE